MAKRSYIKPKDQASMPFKTAGSIGLPEEELTRRRLISALLSTAENELAYQQWLTYRTREDSDISFDDFKAELFKPLNNLDKDGNLKEHKGQADNRTLQGLDEATYGDDKKVILKVKKAMSKAKAADLIARHRDAPPPAFKPKAILIKKVKSE